MPKFLTREQVEQYHEDGYVAPVDIMDEATALQYAERLEEAEARYPGELQGRGRNNAHLAFTFMDEIAFNPSIIDVVEDLIGDQFFLWGTVLFIKDPQSPGYVSWHQDATYMGLEPHSFVTPWLALSHSSPSNGCMSVIPGSHHQEIFAHEDTWHENNVLTRGQEIQDIDESKAVDIVLRPGQISCHHARLVHGSRPNTSEQRRIGVALQAYVPSDVIQTAGPSIGLAVRGEYPEHNHKRAERPAADMTRQGIAYREEANNNFTEILYRDAGKTRNY